MFLFFYIKIDVNEEFLHPHQKLYNRKIQTRRVRKHTKRC
ncbi:hypothetical protein CMALT394_980002 [Carnobacterium maltaromaticum]|nr:hypothetical protein CMALT394_980002 [Carnobacterium maltaromaticum]